MPAFTRPPLPFAGVLLPRPADGAPLGDLGRVTLISGAAGYGKTTLLSQWAQRHADAIAWFNPVREYQPEETLPGILTAIRRAVGNAETVRPDEWQDPERVADEVRRLILDFQAPITLVLDGTHFVAGNPVNLQESFRMFVERQPQNAAAVVSTRNRTIAGAEAARSYGRLDVIDETLLRVPHDEVVRALIDKGASRGTAHEFATLLGGWPAAIGLALALPEIPQELDEFRRESANQGPLQYLTEALLGRITPDLREALILTSIADVISTEVASNIGLDERLVRALPSAQAQGVPLHYLDSYSAYSLHPLLRDQLLKLLRMEFPRQEKALRQTYAEHLVSYMDARAVDQYIQAGDLDAARQYLQENMRTFVERGFAVQIPRWLNQLELEQQDRLESLRKRVFATVIEGDLVRVSSLLDSFYEEMTQQEKVCSDNLSFYYLNLCWIALNNGDLDAMYDNAQKVLALDFPDDHKRREEYFDTAVSYVARYKTFMFQASESDPDIARSLRGTNRGAALWEDVTLPAFRSHIAIYRGEINRALALGERALAAVPETLKGSIYFPWFALVGTAGAYREQGDPKRTLDLIDEFYEEILRLHPMAYAIDLLALKASALADLGSMSEATETFGVLRDLVDRYGKGWWVNDRLDYAEARFLLRHGDESRATQLASRLRDTNLLPSLTLSLDLIAAPKRAAQSLAGIKRESPIQEMNFRLFSALLAQENPELADQHLKHLLALMNEHGAMRVVADRGRPAVDLISVHVSRNPSRYGENLVARLQEALAASKSSGLLSALSKREQQILGMLASSMSLREIAGALFVSQNTLKTHLRHLYKKLQVGGREQAVEQGRKLLLLP